MTLLIIYLKMLLDFFCIFSTGGLILWYKQFVNSKIDSLLNYLIKTILMDQKRTKDTLSINGTVLRWKVSDENKLIFVVAYQEAYSLLYVDKLINMVLTDFIKNDLDKTSRQGAVYLDSYVYNQTFMTILNLWEKVSRYKI